MPNTKYGPEQVMFWVSVDKWLCESHVLTGSYIFGMLYVPYRFSDEEICLFTVFCRITLIFICMNSDLAFNDLGSLWIGII